MRLPNAPLAEVVFELRWQLQGGQGQPDVFKSDPAYPLTAPLFSSTMSRAGFGFRREMSVDKSAPLLGHSIQYRFQKSEAEPFPLIQIGPGIFACNQSTDYEWSSFKKLANVSVSALFRSYPAQLPMVPTLFELRYVDAFNKDLIGHNDLTEFINRNTPGKIILPFLESKSFSGEVAGMLRIDKKFRGIADEVFSLQVGTGEKERKPSIVAISKVVRRARPTDLKGNTQSKVTMIMKWLEQSHKVTSNFFKEFVTNDLMKTFKAAKKK